MERGWSQERLALEAGLSKQAINDLETRKRISRPQTLRALAKIFSIPYRDLQ